MTKRRKMVVVDGSNLATEGRTTPSLRQLDESVRAFLEEYPDHDAIVVADASFEHRVAPAERERVRQAELSGDIVTPPAGVIGRGDAFILKIAKRSNAVVLSNDSFQEFHVEHPWLFEEGRLIGGKPVPKVGWIFTPRNPVRGLKSKTVTKRARREASNEAPTPEVPAATPRKAGAKKAAPAAPSAARSKSASKRVPAAAAAATKEARPARRRGVVEAKSTGASKQPRTRRATPPAAKSATKAAPTPASAPAAKGRVEPVNTPRSFLTLVADHPLGTVVEGEVVQFTSHGAMVAVRVGRTMRVVCYAPLAGLADPAPTRARDVLKKGDTYRFTIVAFDTQRRRAELALEAGS